MGWTETRVVDNRMRFVMLARTREQAFAQLCREFGVSRRIGYKWLARYEAEGPVGLLDRSRAPHEHPHAVHAAIAERCVALRNAHPTWGPVKVRAWLQRNHPEVTWPAASSIGDLFDRQGLTVKRRLRRRSAPSSRPFSACAQPNDVWCIDFKGWFLTGDGTRCEPLTLSDAYSRYLLRCHPVARIDADHVWPILSAAFREFGLPTALRSDNGPPFASRGAGGLSKLAVKVIKAGVLPERIAPGKPQENGRHERFHLTLLQDTASPPAHSLRQQCERFRRFKRLYNEERPHEALNNNTPIEHYAPSSRHWDGVLHEPQYDDDQEVRRVRNTGAVKWRGKLIYISEALVGEPVGLSECADGSYHVSFGPVLLGVITHRDDRLRRPKKQTCGRVDNADALPTSPQENQQQKT